ncbi:uncharacterized protein LOC123718230 isoform X11 [Pieris brassicae]|uniref:uncharacterized protein LOC123718230 isoform X11 n=1 Tax=Pieris brassicae TaxID=7116 RepID=UPI001E65F57A|nr:uncharacterized protein LOC123718230 isoform X11 [Pieris brassicae]
MESKYASTWLIAKDLCRCCHAEGDFFNLATPNTFKDREEIYSDMLRTCFDIEIDPVPGRLCIPTYSICSKCVVKLREAVIFKEQVLKCEKKFYELLTSSSIAGLTQIKKEPEMDSEVSAQIKKEPEMYSEVSAQIKKEPEMYSEVLTQIKKEPETDSEDSTVEISTNPEASSKAITVQVDVRRQHCSQLSTSITTISHVCGNETQATTYLPSIRPGYPKTAAERMKEYRARKKREKLLVNHRKHKKSDAERAREYRTRKKAKLQSGELLKEPIRSRIQKPTEVTVCKWK